MLVGQQTKRVLVIDDELSVTQMMSILLKSRGYEVVVANSGEEGLSFAREKEIDLVLLDLLLPDIEGFELCQRLKSSEKTHHIPVIIVSSRYRFEDKIEGFHLGADDYLTKPFENEELFARMEAVLRRNSGDSNEQREKEKHEIITELRRIIDDGLIIPHYQPIFLLEPFKILGLEVLSRPQTNTILSNPEVLFKMALKYDLYCQLEMVSWRKGLEQVKNKLGQEQLFFNCNPYLVENTQFNSVRGVFNEVGIALENVILELTERSAITEYKLFYDRLQDLRNEGFRFAVDDVGGGYASLESIVETKPEVVKIDRHIITNLDQDSVKRSIVKFIVSFCHENNIVSIAEGIETKTELNIVRELGVDAVQGYYLQRPSPEINLSIVNEIKNKV